MNYNNMAENTTKYLDLGGLQLLWQKISNLYPRTENLVSILDALEDPYLKSSIYNADKTLLEQKLKELEAATGNAMDGDTIWLNPETSKFQTNLLLDIDSEKKTLRLVTKDPDSEITKAKTIISEIDYSPFVKDGLLDSVNLIVIPDDEEATSGREAGTYIKFIFNTDAGKEAIYLNVSEFVNIYKGSDYIIVEGDTIKLDTVKLDTHIEECIEKSVYISGIVTRLQTVEGTVASLQELVLGFDDRIKTVEADVNGVKQSVAEQGARIENIETTLENVPTEKITEQEINELP